MSELTYGTYAIARESGIRPDISCRRRNQLDEMGGSPDPACTWFSRIAV